uniref:TWiK family of potassium channels protein 9 n=1 Tax=Anisakis simplex TaxID=6269 RepID=A0A346RVN6_ANISI|nr:TWiK family of potassium channels protein 9 [Anisakis simplex]
MVILIKRLRNSLANVKLSAIALRLTLIIGVVVYAITGALIMRFLENHDFNDNKNDNDQDEQPLIASSSQRSRQKRMIESDNAASDVVVYETITDMYREERSSNKRLNNKDSNETRMSSNIQAMMKVTHQQCIKRAIEMMFNTTGCNEDEVDRYIIADIDECYLSLIRSNILTEDSGAKPDEDTDGWTFTDALIFAYTVITTIGYGNVAPVTFEGRLFLIIYGLIGIPMTLLTIADLGMFFSKMLKYIAGFLTKRFIRAKLFLMDHFQRYRFAEKQHDCEKFSGLSGKSDKNNNNRLDIMMGSVSSEDIANREIIEAIALLLTFAGYLLCGAHFLSLYEPELDYFNAFYFSFITLTTVGLGDFVPKRDSFLVITMLYITFGLALTTLAIDIAGEYLRRIHYFGREIENAADVHVWFGGQKMKVRDLLRHLGDQLNIPADAMNNLDMDKFVDSAIKVETGEIKTLRKPEPKVQMKPAGHPLSYRDLRKSGESVTLQYVDEWTNGTTTGSEAPLAEETARTITSSFLSTVDEDSIKSENFFVMNRESAKLKESILQDERAESEPPACSTAASKFLNMM